MSEQKQQRVKELQEKVVRYFCDRPGNFPTGRPYNCCESGLLTLAEYLDIDSELIPKIATAIGAGVGAEWTSLRFYFKRGAGDRHQIRQK